MQTCVLTTVGGIRHLRIVCNRHHRPSFQKHHSLVMDFTNLGFFFFTIAEVFEVTGLSGFIAESEVTE